MAGNTEIKGGLTKYTEQEALNAGMGQVGSIFIDASGALQAPSGYVFIAITMVNDCAFDSTDGLISVDGNNYFGASSAGFGGMGQLVTSSDIFPAGLTIYGRWSEIDITSGKLIAYIGT